MNDDIVARLAVAAQYLRVKERNSNKTTAVDTAGWARLAEDAAREINELRERAKVLVA